MKKYKQTYLWLWVLLAVGLAVVCGFSFFDSLKIGSYEMKRGTFPDVILAEERPGGEAEECERLLAEIAAEEAGPREVIAETDTTVRNVLIFGDSMTILVANRLAAYGEKNGYKVTSVTWDASSTVSWSACDTLDNYISRTHPDFIFVTLGSNELFLKNFDSRRPYVERLVAKMDGIPFVWIGPPNWKEDVGFNAMMLTTLPRGTYFDSNGLDLPRGADHIHPTPQGGIIWTDSIMSWMAYSPHPIPAERPARGVGTRTHDSHYYKAGGGKESSRQAAPEAPEQPAFEPLEEEGPREPAPAGFHEPSISSGQENEPPTSLQP